jgi:hypothetical protein
VLLVVKVQRLHEQLAADRARVPLEVVVFRAERGTARSPELRPAARDGHVVSRDTCAAARDARRAQRAMRQARRARDKSVEVGDDAFSILNKNANIKLQN